MSFDNKNLIIFIGLCVLCLGFISSNMLINTSYVTNLPIEENGGLPVNIQDQTTRPLAVRMSQINTSQLYVLQNAPIIDSYFVNFTNVTGLSVNDNIVFQEQNGMPQLYFAEVESIVGNTVELNIPIPFNFTPSKTIIAKYNNLINVDGSTATQVFELINNYAEAIDITRIIFHCTDDVQMHDGLFCGINGLNKPIVFRKKTIDDYYINYLDISNNGKWAEYAYNYQYTDSGKPPDDTYGFSARLTYAGQSKHGVVIRIEPNESIQLVINEDLTGISTASLMLEGHFIQN